MTKVLVVDDDPQVIAMLSRFLIDEGYEVVSSSSGTGALSEVSKVEPDVVLLDIGLGGEDGREVLKEVRLLSDVPVIFLTGRSLEAERIAGLRLGADDYIVKPFSLGEVSARIDAVLRRSAGDNHRSASEHLSHTFGDLVINEFTHEVTLRGELVEVTSKEFDLLAFLATSPRQVFTREQLLERVWASSSEWQNEATVTEHVRRLRAKIEQDPERPQLIVTVRGVGYRFEPTGGEPPQ